MHDGSVQPTRYRLVVRGRVGDELLEAFDHLQLDANAGQSTLTGTFADSAQLYGLLDRLQDLGIPIVSVNPTD
jgi:hypothetical protein